MHHVREILINDESMFLECSWCFECMNLNVEHGWKWVLFVNFLSKSMNSQLLQPHVLMMIVNYNESTLCGRLMVFRSDESLQITPLCSWFSLPMPVGCLEINCESIGWIVEFEMKRKSLIRDASSCHSLTIFMQVFMQVWSVVVHLCKGTKGYIPEKFLTVVKSCSCRQET